ncbi:MAG: hypothetical protein ACM65K_17595 [Microcoleus sp.]
MSQNVRSPFWLRMFLQERAIALHLYQMPNLRSPFWNKSKSAIALLVTNVFAGKSDRPSCIPDAQPAIALLE